MNTTENLISTGCQGAPLTTSKEPDESGAEVAGIDKVVYLRALKALKSTGTALDLTAHQFAESVKVVGRASLIEAARYDRDDLSAPGWRNLTTLIASVLRLQTEAKRCARK